MPPNENAATPSYRIGYPPVLTLISMVPFVVFAMLLPLSGGWRTTAVYTASLFVAFKLLDVFVRQAERRGAPQKQMRIIGYGVLLATAAVAYVVRGLWTHKW